MGEFPLLTEDNFSSIILHAYPKIRVLGTKATGILNTLANEQIPTFMKSVQKNQYSLPSELQSVQQ